MEVQRQRMEIVVKIQDFGIKIREPYRIRNNKKYTKIYHNIVDIIYNKSYGLVLTTVNEARKIIFYIINDIYFLTLMYLWYTAAHGSMMKPPNAKVVSGNAPPPVAATYYTLIYSDTIN